MPVSFPKLRVETQSRDPPERSATEIAPFLRQHLIGKSRRVANLDKDSLCLSASMHFGSSLLLSFLDNKLFAFGSFEAAVTAARRFFARNL